MFSPVSVAPVRVAGISGQVAEPSPVTSQIQCMSALVIQVMSERPAFEPSRSRVGSVPCVSRATGIVLMV